MRRLIILIISTGTLAAAALFAAQTPNVSLCEGIATQIRQNAARSPADPIAPLFKGDDPYIETPSKPDIRIIGDRAQFADLFRQKFQPSDAMSGALDRLSGDVVSLFSLPDSSLHMILASAGSAHCDDFVFFWMPPGRQSQPLPDLPPKGVRDGDKMICEGDGDDPNLARIAGTDAFVEMMSSPTDSNYDLRVVPFQQGKWGPACEVEADFGSEYNVSKVFVPAGGPISDIALKEVAAEIIEQHAAAKDPKSFFYGPLVPESEKDNVRTMLDLAAGMQRKQARLGSQTVPVPAFGRENELGAFEDSLGLVDDYPVVLYGNTYLMAIGHGVIGWRESPDSGLILYTLKDGKLEPVGAAMVGQSQGALQSVRATEWKLRGVTH
ncbi:MAG: hypothetical protein WA020_07585 [Candidatus Acidiferrales bacterium]